MIDRDVDHLPVEGQIVVARSVLREPVQEIEAGLGVEGSQVELLVQLVRHVIGFDVGLQLRRIGAAGAAAAARAGHAPESREQRRGGVRRLAATDRKAGFRDIDRRRHQEIVGPQDHRADHDEQGERTARRHRADAFRHLLGQDLDRPAPLGGIEGELLAGVVGH